MNPNNLNQNNLQTRMYQGTKKLFTWTLAWLISTAAVAHGPEHVWDYNQSITYIAIVLNLFLGFTMVVVNKNHLLDMDELQRRIHFNAMGISLGSTLVFGTAYGLLQPAGLLSNTPNPSNILFVTGISYLISVALNYRKYA